MMEWVDGSAAGASNRVGGRKMGSRLTVKVS